MSAGQTPITEQLWYYLDKEDNNSKTLIHFRALVRLYELRKVDKHTQIWRETMEGWLPIHSVPELYQALKQLSGVPEEPEWMYIDPSSGVQKGPCTVVEFKGLLASAPSSSASSSTSASTVTINQDTYGWRQGMSAWVRLVEIPELQHIFAEGTGSSASTGASVSSSSAPALTADGLPVFGIEGGAAVEWHFIAAAAAATTASTSSQLGPVSLFSLVEDYVTLQQQERRKEKEKEEPGSTASYPRLPSLKYRITDDTMCWKAGMAEWSPFKSVPDLTAAVKKYIFSSRKAQKKLGKKKKRKTPGSSSVAHTSNNNNITSSTAGAGDQHAKKQKSASSSPSDMDTDSSGRADAGSSSSTATASNGKKKKWKSTEKHNNIYVTGLPGDATLDEMYEFFKKCGVIKEDHTGKPRIKLYTLTNSNSGGGDDDKSKSNGHGGGDGGGGQLKGDGLVCYLRPESVSLALDLLDQSPFRPLTHPSKLIRVQKAEFTMKVCLFIGI